MLTIHSAETFSDTLRLQSLTINEPCQIAVTVETDNFMSEAVLLDVDTVRELVTHLDRWLDEFAPGKPARKRVEGNL